MGGNCKKNAAGSALVLSLRAHHMKSAQTFWYCFKLCGVLLCQSKCGRERQNSTQREGKCPISIACCRSSTPSTVQRPFACSKRSLRAAAASPAATRTAHHFLHHVLSMSRQFRVTAYAQRQQPHNLFDTLQCSPQPTVNHVYMRKRSVRMRGISFTEALAKPRGTRRKRRSRPHKRALG
jgi:hypothetical protein